MKTRLAALLAFFLLAGWPAACFAEGNQVDSRESAVDRALGGMVEGSRMPAPEGSFGERGRRVPGSMLSPRTDTGTSAPAPAVPGVAGPSAGTGPGSSTANEPAGGTAGSGGSFESSAPETSGGGTSGGGLESSGGGGGDLVGGTGGGSNLGGGSGPSGTGDTEVPGGTETTGGGAIIDIDADVSLEGETVNANLDAGVNTEGGSLLELDAATDIVADEPIAAEVDSTESAVIETDLGVEEGINEAPASGEAEAGIEADVDASGEPDEPVDNPADGLAL